MLVAIAIHQNINGGTLPQLHLQDLGRFIDICIVDTIDTGIHRDIIRGKIQERGNDNAAGLGNHLMEAAIAK